MAYKVCQCIPWDFLPTLHNPEAEVCDVFGRNCFQNAMNNVSKNGKDYKHCIGECDMMQFYLRVLSEKDLTAEKNLVLQQVVNFRFRESSFD